MRTLNLAADEARQRFADAAVARLATVGPAGQPHLVPVTFAVDGDHIYTAVDAKPKTTANLRRLRNIAGNPRVAVLADHYEADWDGLWWARAPGAGLGGNATAVGAPANVVALASPNATATRSASGNSPVTAYRSP